MACEVDTCDWADISDVWNTERARKPLETGNTVLCDEKNNPTVPLIEPLKPMMEQSMTRRDEECSTVANRKKAILKKRTSRTFICRNTTRTGS